MRQQMRQMVHSMAMEHIEALLRQRGIAKFGFTDGTVSSIRAPDSASGGASDSKVDDAAGGVSQEQAALANASVHSASSIHEARSQRSSSPSESKHESALGNDQPPGQQSEEDDKSSDSHGRIRRATIG